MQISYIFAEKQPIFSSKEFDLLLNTLPKQRLAKITRIQNEPNRQLSLLASLLLAKVLSDGLSVSPKDLSFSVSKHGKPFLPDFPEFHFSLSHSGLCAAVAIDSFPIGLDVEKIGPYRHSIPSRFFTKNEQDHIQTCGTNEAFFEIWTQKEAYVKQCGTGFSVSPESFNVKDPTETKRLFSQVYNNYMFSLCVDRAHLPLAQEDIHWQEYTCSELSQFFLS
ncbi:MAG: 4'-phosphopantetheinyl transferase family protein [Lachnospiraceae bacterium]